MREAVLYEKRKENRVQCHTCAQHCLVREGERGKCGVMENRDGTLFSLVYGKAVAMHVDPIEKKPLFHFYPGSLAFSVATVGCNMTCLHCQNADISQMPRDRHAIQGRETSPETVAAEAGANRCRSIACTYTEPAVFLDYAHDIAVKARDKGIQTVFVSNGFFSKQGLDRILPLLDGANIDLKAYREDTYHRICGARLAPVLDTIVRMREAGVWVEVTTLLIPDLNDSDEELDEIARFIHSVDPAIPWHISRFHPTYRLQDRPPTPVERIQRAVEIGESRGLRFVYSGNVPGDKKENTYCPRCKSKVIGRRYFEVTDVRLKQGKCPDCGETVEGVW